MGAALTSLVGMPGSPAVKEESKPIFSFGIVADIQYADKDNGVATEDPGRIKYYREAPQKLAYAVNYFNSVKEDLCCILTLGDIVDGNDTEEQTLEDFKVVLGELANLQVPLVYHVIGNHCLSVPRTTLISSLKLPSSYYEKVLHPGWRLIALDSMDLSLCWDEGSEKDKEALQFLQHHPLQGAHEPQMKPWNGGIGKEQLQWLKQALSLAAQGGDRVIVALHHPVAPGSAPDSLLLWNYKEVLDVLVRNSSVDLVLCGHHHVGGYRRVGHTHFVCVDAILEAPPGSEAHGVVKVHADRVEIAGSGFVRSRSLELQF